MSEHVDDRLVAYLDSELEMAERRAVEARLAADPAAAARLAALVRSDNLLRRAFEEVLHEPVPDRIIAAALGEPGAVEPRIVRFVQHRPGKPAARRWWRIMLPIAASIIGVVAGGGAVYLGVVTGGGAVPATETAAANDVWLDTAAGYFKLFVNTGDHAFVDLPASADPRETWQRISQSLPQAVRLPDLKPWGLIYRGA